MNTTTSYQKCLNKMEAFILQHLQIKKYAFDFEEQMGNHATIDEKYPFVYIAPGPSTFGENINTFSFNVYCFDIILKDRSNINTILSDTNQILNDLYRYFYDNDDFDIELLSEMEVTPMNNALFDYCAGWKMNLVLTVSPYSICDIPLEVVS